MKTYFKKPIYSALIFFSTLWVLSIWYGAYNALSPVNTWDPLTKTIWNQMVDNITDLNTRVSTLASSGSLWASNWSDISYTAWNVWIWISAPDKQLHIKTSSWNAEINIQSTNKDKWGIYHKDDWEDLIFWNLSNILTLQKNWNVWIWTDDPSSRLTLAKSLTTWYNTMLRLDENSNAWANAMGIDWRFWWLAWFPWGDGGSVWRVSVERQWSTSNFDMVFWNASSTNFSEKMRIVASNWKVWIWTASPNANLTVQNPTDWSDTALQLRSADWSFSTNQELRLDFQQQAGNIARIAMAYFWSDWWLNFYWNNSWLNTNPIMSMRGNGNVWIWTSSPKSLLSLKWTNSTVTTNALVGSPATAMMVLHDISSSQWAGGQIAFISGYGDSSGVNTITQASLWAYKESSQWSDWWQYNHSLVFNTDSYPSWLAEKMRITSAWNVWIGTASPSYKLHVSWTAAWTSWTNLSDQRYKKNIETIENPLDIISKLRWVTFDWRKDEFKNKNFTSGQKVWFIAQEVEGVLPQVVTTDKEWYKWVEYANLTAVLVEAVKELRKQNIELKNKIELLEKIK
ncbi:MAG: hypothetical protein ACD_3C00021G0001 [uncultured bacterium (gcode 4)]|uniref:Peptidase S74 domain-containing protein n=1 Tax=uncultured bacterium (gcode 4) TaxID=1234023 RepID=K2G370_9BACT|nr:MAG: hypothetical protein ACD_3C00021G0001 [uncultured bacterium (gcode 4)]